MPAILVAEHVAPVTSPVPSVSVEDLSNGERAVALYASDMPTGYSLQGPVDTALIEWMVQGVKLLGREEVRRRASYLAGHRKLWLRDLMTPEINRRHKARFPSARRLRVAESMASTSLFWVSVAPEARELPVVIDGTCPRCDGAGKLWVNLVIDDVSGWFEEGYAPCWVCRDGGAA
ncbi:hypothetical protein [Streptomyces leeuwenhoekii]|uniref:Uncharacterized protein n=1 Tax=Streptomyces leeuwenhoekii TaxID=1437453 RepID=A0A0F7VRS0_STRLW|nr:hypothetical protein [Streptomyces leeuwenhoekii]CQR62470.1 Hypothetical Protein sle_30090 [Streptomyces leeuwenhoekii]